MPFQRGASSSFQPSGSSSGNGEAFTLSQHAARLARVREAVLGMELDDTLYTALRTVDPAAAEEHVRSFAEIARMRASREAQQHVQQVVGEMVTAEVTGHPGQSA